MKNNSITKKIFVETMAVLIIAELASAIAAMIDGLVTSRYLGAEVMSAYGIASSYFSILAIISGLVMIGCQALVVEAVSKGNKKEASGIMNASLIAGFVLSVILCLVLVFFPRPIAILFGASKDQSDIIYHMSEYFRGLAPGAICWVLFMVLTPIAQLDGGGKYAKFASLACALSDIIFDVVFGVLLDMKLFGMGLATALSQFVALIVIMLFFFSKKSTIKIGFKELRFEKLGKIFANGLPRAISMISRTAGPIILNIIVLNIVAGSTLGMSALSIQRSISFCVSSIGWGIGGATLMVGSLYYNERNYSEFKFSIIQSLKSVILYVGALSIILLALTSLIGRLYVSDYKNNLELYNLSCVAFIYYFLSLPFLAFNVAFASYMQAVEKKTLTYIINVCIECVSLVASCFVLSRFFGYEGFFAGFLVGEALITLICGIAYAINYFKNKNSAYQRIVLPSDFISEDTIVIEKNLEVLEDAVNLSSEISELCKNSKLPPNKIYKLSLAIEEMATNVFTHGFKKDNKKHHVMVRVVVEGDKGVVTLIDDCKQFDITKKLKSWELDPEHPEKYIGIRMIMLLAKKISYTNTMNTNNLQIEI